MFARITASRKDAKALGDFELPSGANPAMIWNDYSYAKGSEIYGEKEPADYVYQVKIGAVRSYQLLSDGRRQIGAFHLVGDIFGLTAGDHHRFTAEAVVDTTLRLIKRQRLELMATTDAALTHSLLSVTARNLRHAEDHMLLLGRKDALEKVATFLLEMDKRLTIAGAMTLPMIRHDIADYLGLTLETVSRALSRLRRKGALSVSGDNHRTITILNRELLRSFDLQ